MRRAAASLLMLTLTIPVWAGTDTGADFLKIPIGARAVAMGQAFTALADETDALSWNTAGVAPINSDSAAGRLSFSHEVLFFGNSLDHVSATLPKGNSGFGLSITRLSYPTQESRDADRNVTGNFGANDLSVGLAYAASYRGLRVGTKVNYLQQAIANQSASGFSVDLGALSRTPINRLNVGVSVRNLGPSMQFVSERFNLPLVLAAGAAFRVAGPLILALDLQHRPYDRQTSISIGSEFSAASALSLRAGYLAKVASAVSNSQQSETNRGIAGGLSGMNAGFGLKFANLALDYAMTPFGELGDVQSLTLSTAFGGNSGSSKTRKENKKSTSEPLDAPDRDILIFDQSHDADAPWWSSK